jgi:proliferating cell nuclear antigen PCNA
MPGTIFKCKTNEAYKFKILAELLSNNIKIGSFEISKEGISLRMFDVLRNVMIDVFLNYDNFSQYKLGVDNLRVGVNLKHFYKILKSSKKKDSIQLFINKSNPHVLNIRTFPKENTRITTTTLKIQPLQHIDVEAPTGYDNYTVVNSTDFQKMCKELVSLGSNDISVVSNRNYIDFSANVDGVFAREVRLGETDDTYISDSDEDETASGYNATFSTELFSRIQKVTNLGDIMQIYTTQELPLMIRTSVGTIGKISVYVKSNEGREAENNLDSSDEE